MPTKFFLIASTLALTACASAGSSGSPNGVQVAHKEDMQGCKFIGDVHGASSHYGMFAGAGFDNAREEAMDRVKEMGGTHVVWGGTNSGFGGTTIDGDAYKCPNSQLGGKAE